MHDIYFDPNDMHQTVDATVDNEEVWILGPSFSIEPDENEIEDDFAVIKQPPKRYENGCSCVKCGELYPQSEPNQPDGTLICYSCRRFMKK